MDLAYSMQHKESNPNTFLLQSVVKNTFWLPVVSTITPVGGKGIIHKQTLYKEGIYVKINFANLVLAEISNVVNWLPPQSNQFKALFFVTSRMVNRLDTHSNRVNNVFLETFKLDNWLVWQLSHFKAILLETSKVVS